MEITKLGSRSQNSWTTPYIVTMTIYCYINHKSQVRKIHDISTANTKLCSDVAGGIVGM